MSSELQQTISLVRKLRPDDIGISVSYPLPGTVFYERVQSQLGAKRNWTDSDDLCVMFRATYKDEFYKALRNALHAEVDSWKGNDSPENGDTNLLWQQVFNLEPKMRNAEATTLASSVPDETGTQNLIPLHALAAAGGHI